jgi:hypothetical protein
MEMRPAAGGDAVAAQEPRHTPRKRAPNGAGSIWDKSAECFVGLLSLGKGPDDRRLRRKVTGHSEEEVRAKLDDLRRDFDNGLDLENKYTVADAARDFLAHGTHHLAKATVDELRYIARSGSSLISAT